MKDKFPGHFLSEEAKDRLWEESLFVFDANILLDVYRYSEEAKESLLKAIESIQDKVWLPHRAAKEYLDNRIKVIQDQGAEYERAISEIESLKKKLDNKRSHPFISSKAMVQVGEALNAVTKELIANKEIHNSRILKDEIRERIAEIFYKKVGEELSAEEVQEIIKEGEDRYKNKIPPGYSDLKKQGQEETLAAVERPYGDLIIWKTIIKKSVEENKPVIFVTGDKKEDWWLRASGKTVGPRPELIEEFQNKSGQKFYMYAPETFIQRAPLKSNKKPSKEIIEEIRNAGKENIRKQEDINREFVESAALVTANAWKAYANTSDLLNSARFEAMNKASFELAKLDSEERDIEKGLQTLERDRDFHASRFISGEIGAEKTISKIENEIEYFRAKLTELKYKKAEFMNEKWAILNGIKY